MLKLTIEKRYIDVYTGKISLISDGRETILSAVVMGEGTNFKYKGKPRDLDGKYLLVYKHYFEEGFQFRPMLNHKTLEFRFTRRKYPRLTSRDVIYLLQEKRAWEEKCRRLYARGEHLLSVEGYDHRAELPLIEERFFQIEDYSDIENIEDEDFINP